MRDLNDKGMAQIFLVNVVTNINDIVWTHISIFFIVFVTTMVLSGLMFPIYVPMVLIGLIFSLLIFEHYIILTLRRRGKLDTWCIPLCSHNWRWFWKTQKHRVDFNRSMTGTEEQEMMKYLSQYKSSDWVAFCTSFINVTQYETDPIYLSFRTKEMAIEYKMRYG